MHLEIIAFFAGLISSTAAIPQIVRMIRTKKTSGVSTFMFCMKNCSNSLWVLFGIYSMTYSIIFWNVISFTLCTTVIVMKYRILREKERRKQANSGQLIRPMFVAVDNTLSEPIQIIKHKAPIVKLVYSRPAEQNLPEQMPATSAEMPVS